MLIGYARISTDDQNLDLQRDALQKAGCDRIYTDQKSGASTERLGLRGVLDLARAGDALVVWRLDRLGRSLKHLIQLVENLDHQGIGLKSLQENIDTTTSGGRLVFHLLGALAEKVGQVSLFLALRLPTEAVADTPVSMTLTSCLPSRSTTW